MEAVHSIAGGSREILFDAGSTGVMAWLIPVLLLTVRLTVALALSPAMASFGVPAAVRILLVFALAALTISAPAAKPDLGYIAPEQLALAALAEMLTGALLGLGVHVVLAAFSVAGRLLDVQIGFGIGSVFDPVSRSSQSVMGTLMSVIGVALFFVTNAHLSLASMLARSLAVFPIGRFPAIDNPLPLLCAAGSMFTMGVALAAPTAIALVLTDLFVGITSRNMPQINVLVLAIPLKVLIAYLVLAYSVRGWAPVTDRMFDLVADVLGGR